MAVNALEHVRALALELPAVSERASHGAPCFYIREKRPLCYFHPAGFHGDGTRVALWCPAPDGVPEDLVAVEPERFFRPTPSASGVFSNWLGVYLDSVEGHRVDWREIAAVIDDAFRTVAPKTLVAELDALRR